MKYALLAFLFLSGLWLGSVIDGPVAKFVYGEPVNYSRIDRAEFLLTVKPSGRIAIVGDSHVQRADWNALLGRTDVANYGIGGDDTVAVLSRLDAVKASNAEQFIVLVGINDLLSGVLPGTVAANIEQMIVALDPPRVTVLSIMPTRGKHEWVNPIVRQANNLLADVCTAPCRFVQTLDAMPVEYSRDGLHLTVRGYAHIGSQLALAGEGST